MPGYMQFFNCLQAYRFSDLSLQVTTANNNEIDVGTNTLTFTTLSAYVIQEQVFRESVPNPFPYVRSEQAFLQQSVSATGDLEIRLPAGGYYSRILARAFSTGYAGGTLGVKQADTTAFASSAPFDTSPGTYITLFDLNRRIKYDVDFYTIREKNLTEVLDTLVTGNWFFNFDGGTDALFWTGEIEKSEANVILKCLLRTGTNAFIRFVYERYFDPNDYYKNFAQSAN
jgi:hypothetical protein